MTEDSLHAPRRLSGPQERLYAFISSRRDKMFGVAEILALGGSCVVFLLVLLSYLYFLLPARSHLATLQADRLQLKANLQKSELIVSRDRGIKQTVDRIAESLETFESVGLVGKDRGRMTLYDQLNQLIVKNGLLNTSGPTYTTLEPLGGKMTPGKSSSTKWQTVYPGIAVDVTVEGSYQSLRHFIRDIELSKQFVIINQVELQRATNNNSTVDAAAASTAGTGSRASLVSLQLNMVTYFQRSNSAESSRAAQGQ